MCYVLKTIFKRCFKPVSSLSVLFICAVFLTGTLMLLLLFQEPGPAKVAVTGSGIPEADPGPDSSSIIWQEELSQREVEGATVWSAADLPPLGALPPPAGLEGNHSYLYHTLL